MSGDERGLEARWSTLPRTRHDPPAGDPPSEEEIEVPRLQVPLRGPEGAAATNTRNAARYVHYHQAFTSLALVLQNG